MRPTLVLLADLANPVPREIGAGFCPGFTEGRVSKLDPRTEPLKRHPVSTP